MFAYIVRRLLMAIPMLFATSLLVFTIFAVSKVDPVRRFLGERSQDEALVQRMRNEWGLNDPAHVRYGRFLKGIVTADFGRSMRTGRPVMEEIRTAFPATVELGFCAFVLSLVFGLGAGIVAGLKRNTAWDYAAMGGALLAVSLPVFWLALLLSYAFSVRLQWLPLDMRLDMFLESELRVRTGLVLVDSVLAGRWDIFRDALRHLVLPSVTLAMVSAALVARMTRSSVLEVARQDFVRTAEAKGLGPVGKLRHILRNALIPVVTIVGLEIPAMLGGAVVTEWIFSWPGMGRLLIDSILHADVTAAQGVIMFLTVLFILTNLVVDVLYGVIDPRLRGAQGG